VAKGGACHYLQLSHIKSRKLQRFGHVLMRWEYRRRTTSAL